MFQEQKNNLLFEPSASVTVLKKRAELLSSIRYFFNSRGVLEVETPLLCQHTVTDPYIASMRVNSKGEANQESHLYLQTSPEYAMKRLLANAIGPIYQICKAFRQGEKGRLHNPEFSLLEWYRPGYDHNQLMDEVAVFLKEMLNVSSIERLTFQAVFEKYLNLNPHGASLETLKRCALQHIPQFKGDHTDLSFWLDLLFSHCIEPNLGKEVPIFIYDFPSSHAALAKIRLGTPALASRFEVYFHGIELANGFHELQDEKEQRDRFLKNQNFRKKYQLEWIDLDERFLAALKKGLPDCAGVALGIDRLCMLLCECEKIQDVLSFDHARA